MRVLRGIWGVLLFSTVAFAQMDEGAQPEGKAADYYRILLKNPRPGYLFERFCNSWLETHDLKELETFLASEKANGAGNLLLLALYYDRAGNHDKALELCSEALQSDSDNSIILFYRAQLLERLGRLADAAVDLEAVAGAGGKLRPDALKNLGRVMIRQGQIAKGVQFLETLLKEEGDDRGLQEEVIELKVDEGLYDEALADCDQMMKTSKSAPAKVMLSLRKASILLRLDRRDEALETLDQSLESVAAGSWLEKEILSRISRAFRTQDDLSGLSDHYAKLLKAHPNNLALLEDQINVMLERSDNDAALQNARTLVKLAPMDETVREFYVEVLRECEKYEEAINIVLEMLARNPENNELRIRLAGFYFYSKETDKIRPVILDYLEHSSKKEYDYFRAARLMARFGDPDDATPIYLDCLKVYPDSLETREALAYHLIRREKVEEAQVHIDAIQEQGDEGGLIRVSGILCGAGHPELARAVLNGRRTAFGTSPRYLEAIYQAYLATPPEQRIQDGLQLTLSWLRTTASMEELRRAAYAVQSELSHAGSEREFLEDLVALPSRTIPETYLLSSMLVREAEPQKAAAVVEDALQADPANLLLLSIRLEQARKQNDFERAVDTLNRLGEASPDRRLAWIREHVSVLMDAEDYEGAQAKLEQWKLLSRDNPQVYLREADILQAQEKTEEAIARLRRAAFRLRESAELHERLASLYMQEGRAAEAEQVFWALVDEEEDLQQKLARFSKLVDAVRWTDRMEAITVQMVERAEENKQAVFPLLALAECYRATWNNEAHRKVLLQLLELKPDDTAIMRSVAKAEADAGNYGPALSLMRQVARKEKNEQALLDLAAAQFEFGNPDKGLEILRQECSLDHADDLVKIACAMLSNGAAEQLVDLLAVRLGEFPDDYRIPFLYAVSLEETGDVNGAAETFMRLLAVDKERPGQSVSPAASMFQGGWFPVEELPTMIRFIEIVSMADQAYAYRNNRGGRSGGTSSVAPTTVDQLLPYTVAHLKDLSPQMDESGRKSILLAMEQAEVPYVDMVMQDLQTIFMNPQWWQEQLEKNPDDVELAYFAALLGFQIHMNGMGGGYPDALCGRLFNLLVDKHPDAALLALFCGEKRSEKLLAKVPQLLERCAMSHRRNEMIVYVPAGMASGVFSDAETPEVKQAFVEYAKRLPDSELAARISIFMSLHAGDELVEEIARMDTLSSQTSARNQFVSFSRSFNQGAIQSLSFPPEGVLDARLVQLSADADEEMVEVFKTIENPVTRLALLSEMLDETELAKIVAEIEEGTTGGFEKNILLGSWYGMQEQPAKALGYLIRARHSAPSAAARKRIDGALLDCALVLEEMTDDQRRELKAAVLRLSSAQISEQDGAVLVELRKKLGMRERKVATAAAQSVSPFSIRTSRQSVADRVQQLLTDGKTDQALQEAAILMRRSVPDMMTLSGNSNDWELRNCMNLLKDHEVSDSFVALFKPEEGASSRKWLEYAVALDSVGKADDAAPVYERILEQQPAWAGVRCRVAASLVGQPEEAAALISELSPMQLMQVVDRFDNMLSGGTPAEQRLHLVELTLYLCPKLFESRQPVFAGTYLGMLEDSWRGLKVDNDDNTYTLPGLFDEIETTTESDHDIYQLRYRKVEALVNMQQRRKELYLELCELFIGNDATAKDGFAGKAQYYRFYGVDSEPLFEQAEEILLRVGDSASPAMGGLHMFFGGLGADDKVEIEEYYASECRRRDLRSRFEQTLAAIKDPQVRQPLELQQRFYFSNEQEFRDLLAEQFKKNRRNGNMQTLQVSVLFRAYEQCGYTFDLTPMLVELLDPNRQETVWFASEWMKSWIETCLRAGRNEMAVGAMNSFFDKLFSPSDLAKLQPEGSGSATQMQANTVNNRVNIIESIFQELDADLPTWFGLVEVVSPMLHARRNGGYSLSEMYSSQTNKTVEMVLQTPFVNDWDAFRAYAFNSEENLLMNFLYEFVDLDEEKKETELGKVLDAIEPPTFGSRLLTCIADAVNEDNWESAGQGLMVLCGEYQAQIEASDELRRTDLFNLLMQLQDQIEFEVSEENLTNETAVAFLKYYQEQCVESYAEASERLLKGQAAQQAGNSYDFYQEAGQLVRQMARRSPDTAMRLVERMMEVADLSQQRRSSSSSYSDPAEQVFDAVLDYGSPNNAVLAMMLSHAVDTGLAGGWTTLNTAFKYKLASRGFEAHCKRLEADGTTEAQAKQLAARETLAELDNAVAEVGCPPVLAATAWLAEQCGDRTLFMEWLNSEDAAHLKHRNIYRFVAQDKSGAQGAAEMKALIESGCEQDGIRAAFALCLYTAGDCLALDDAALVGATFNAVQVLPAAQWLDESGAAALVRRMKNPDSDTLDSLYKHWRAVQREFPKFGSRQPGISVAIADMLVQAGRIENAAHVLRACKDTSLSSLVVWVKLKEESETRTCMNDLVSEVRKKDRWMDAASVDWTAEDRDWFMKLLGEEGGQESRFVRLCASTIWVDGAEPDIDFAAVAADLISPPFENKNLEWAVVDLLIPLGDGGALDEVLVSLVSEDKLIEYLKSGHNPGLSRVKAYINALVRMENKEKMAALGRLHDQHNDKPGCVHEKQLRDVVRKGEHDLGIIKP
jgi:tetratricopeptide (TPR) repeat protein